MRVLLTGASGQLGAYLIESRWIAAGHDVGRRGAAVRRAGGVALRPVDLTDAGPARRVSEEDPEVIVHAAAMSARGGRARVNPRGAGR